MGNFGFHAHCTVNKTKTLTLLQHYYLASQMVQVVKNLPASAGDVKRCRLDPWVGKIPLEWEAATHSSILAWRIPWTEEPGGLQSVGSQRVRCNSVT